MRRYWSTIRGRWSARAPAAPRPDDSAQGLNLFVTHTAADLRANRRVWGRQRRRRWAREVLILLNSLSVFLFLPLLVGLLFRLCDVALPRTVGGLYWYLCIALFTRKTPFWPPNGSIEWQPVTPGERLLVWALFLGPYIVVQLVRVVRWAVKTRRESKLSRMLAE